MTQTKTEKKPAAAKKPTTPAASKAETKPAPVAKKSKAKAERTTKYLPSMIGLVLDPKGKPAVLVGKRRIEAATEKGSKLAETRFLFWSQIKYVVVGKDKAGKLHLTTAREAAAKGYSAVE